jgi:hypothetical protein
MQVKGKKEWENGTEQTRVLERRLNFHPASGQPGKGAASGTQRLRSHV